MASLLDTVGGVADIGFSLLAVIRNLVFMLAVVVAVSVLSRDGVAALIRKLVGVVRLVPGVEELIAWALKKQVRGFLCQLDPETFAKTGKETTTLAIPKKGQFYHR